MAKPFATRRAAIYRERAQQLAEIAAQPRDEADRKHLRDQVATYQRAADALAPPPTAPHLSGAFKGLFDPPRVRTNVPQTSKERSR